MKSIPIVDINNVSKKYCKSLKRSMIYGFFDISRNIFGIRTKSEKLRKKEFWALDNIDLKLGTGDILGIIGANGSGKSTLLKLLNGIFWPDKGQITIRGRVGALIEVGAGFHPLLSGRENIFLNGAILGMSKKEVENKFDDIVKFAEIGDFLDTPVKHYSSGMFVRLGFSVAAHCDPEILLIDEILSVGDLNFQLKCRKKIKEMREKRTTIILVSHNMHTINYLCDNTLVLNHGKKIFYGETNEAIDLYKESQNKKANVEKVKNDKKAIRITDFSVMDNKSETRDWFRTGDYIKFNVSVFFKRELKNFIANISIYDEFGNVVTGIRNDHDRENSGILIGRGEIDLEIEKLNLLPGFYKINVNIIDPDGFTILDRIEGVRTIRISGGKEVNGVAYFPHQWTFKSSEEQKDK